MSAELLPIECFDFGSMRLYFREDADGTMHVGVSSAKGPLPWKRPHLLVGKLEDWALLAETILAWHRRREEGGTFEEARLSAEVAADIDRATRRTINP